jgi:hypothetical protein
MDLNKSGEKYIAENHTKIYGAVSGSGSEWVPKINKNNLLNHTSVEYSLLSPAHKNISKTKGQIFKEAENQYNPGYFQKSISEFTDLSRVFGAHKNPIFTEAIQKCQNGFNQMSNICNSYYKTFKSYEGISLKPFTQNKFQ